MFKNVVNGLLYLHGMAIAHRDIKMENVVVGEDLSIVKFIDFGLCIDMNSLRNRDEMCWQFCGTISYMPPEILRKQGYDPRKSDVWSLGVLLYCLAYGRFPYRGKDEGKVLEKIQNGRLVFPKDGD